jgi:micrococcal nuclease
LCLLVVARYFFASAPPPSLDRPLPEGSHRVVRVVDGDTIVIAPDSFVRLIGVDTPETVKPEHPVEPFGPEATRFTRQFLAGGSARLSFDRERVDRFGRFLAYVWVGDRLLNEELLRAGLARWEPNFNYSADMKRRFRQAQDEARRAGLGIWSTGPVRANGQSRSRRNVEAK